MTDNKNNCEGCFGASFNDCEICPHSKEKAMEIKRIDKFLELMSNYVPREVTLKLQEMGFFDKPASIHHHGQYDGALFDHSYEVTKALVDMTEKLGLTWELERSPYIVGMFHDLCKLDNYIRTADMVAARIKGV